MILSLFGGLFLGFFFFQGLYFTTQKVVNVKHPGLFMLASLIVRMSALIGGTWLLFRGNPVYLLFTCAGIFIARQVVVNRVKKEGDHVYRSQ